MELYTNSTWIQCYGNVYVAEAVAWSENGNHATIYATGISADEADTKLAGALREFKQVPQALERRIIRGDIPPNPHHSHRNREHKGATPRSDLDRLEQVVDRIMDDIGAPGQDEKSTSCAPRRR